MSGNVHPPHPLAVELIGRLGPRPNARILDLGTGSGRNAAALSAAGFFVCAIPDDRTRDFGATSEFDAAISTHALLHGTWREIEMMLDVAAQALKPDGLLYATFGSTSDARYGAGTRIDESTFAPTSGDEEGVAHTYFDEDSLRGLLKARFVIESMEERNVDRIAGTWAHAHRPQGSVHWIVRTRRR
jgi:SAM-dependent methyltransferase